MRQLLAALIVGLVLGLPPATARAEFGVAPGSFKAEMTDTAGDPETRPGAHPDAFRVSFALNQRDGRPDGGIKDLQFELPRGFFANPKAIPTCPREALATGFDALCPPETQVGVVDVELFGVGVLHQPVYSLETHEDGLAQFGFRAAFVASRITARLRPDGRAVVSEVTDIASDFPVLNMSLELWGVPADHQTGSTLPRRAFLTTPTTCDTPPAVALRLRSWEQPDSWASSTAEMPALSGCESLSFQPRLDFSLPGASADVPTATEVNLLTPPASDDPDARAGDLIESLVLELPDGMALSPSAANGLVACSEAAVHVGEAGPTSCPPASKVGTVELVAPSLDRPLEGTIYLGDQLPGNDYRLFMVVADPRGVDLKLRLSLHADPETGRLTARTSDLPAIPFERMTIRFAGGSRAPIVSPPRCGTSVASAVFTPYGGGPSVASSDVVTTATGPAGRPCPGALPFAPDFVAGVSRPRAGIASPLTATIRRGDGEQFLGRFGMTLPAGVSARLGSVEPCSKAAAAAVACPRSSRIGSAVTEAGSGPTPYPLGGDVFLTGPYRRAPFGLMITFRGAVGPFDLGTIAVRAALSVDPRTGQVTVRTDSLPRVVRGIQLRLQTIGLDIDRPGFITTPTSCAERRVGAAIESVGGAVARPSSRFVVGGCRRLRFRPTLSMALRDRSELRAGGRPGVRLSVRSAPGGANLRKVKVDLPKMLEASVIGPPAICSLEQAKDGRCPPEARIGSASARTPLLSVPLRGGIYSVQPPGNGPPDVWALIRGQGVAMSFRMKARTLSDGGVRGTLLGVPDVPFSIFTMSFAGGEGALFSATRGVCSHGRARRVRATARMTAHSRAARRVQARVRTPSRC